MYGRALLHKEAWVEREVWALLGLQLRIQLLEATTSCLVLSELLKSDLQGDLGLDCGGGLAPSDAS